MNGEKSTKKLAECNTIVIKVTLLYIKIVNQKNLIQRMVRDKVKALFVFFMNEIMKCAKVKSHSITVGFREMNAVKILEGSLLMLL